MIALTIPARSEARGRFVTRLADSGGTTDGVSVLVAKDGARKVYSGQYGLFEVTLVDEDIDGDILVIDPTARSAERLVRANSHHNTFLVTERCDQLCVMCSQPPKKTHIDRWAEFTEAAMLAPAQTLIGLSGGEPTLYKGELFDFLETVHERRPDLSFHVLTNGQHFTEDDLPRLRGRTCEKVAWGIPLYSSDPSEHDAIVAKAGAHVRLRDSLSVLLEGGAHVELRTVLLSSNIDSLPRLGEYVAGHLAFVDQWSIMQLEAAGFAQKRFFDLAIDTDFDFVKIAQAIDFAELYGVAAALFNFPLCAIPASYRRYAVPSISDWKRKLAPACGDCTAAKECAGFFAWHPDIAMNVRPL